MSDRPRTIIEPPRPEVELPVMRSTHNGAWCLVGGRRTEFDYLPLPEIVELIRECRALNEGRGITAILRILHEQAEPRTRYVSYLTIAQAMLIFAVCLVSGTLVAGGGLTTLLYALAVPTVITTPSVIYLLRHRRLIGRYVGEMKEMDKVATSAIGSLVLAGHFPRRLYGEDVRVLKSLAKTPAFRGVVKEIIGRAENR